MNREEYFLCYYNGKKHIDLARRLGSEEDYGTAITFLVLGLEELIKFIVIQMSTGKDIRFSEKDFNNLFSSHNRKHHFLIEYLRATKPGFEEDFVLSIFNKIRGIPLTDSLKDADSNRFREIGSMLGMTERHLTAQEVDEFIEWLAKDADHHKNKGLYVDRIDKSVGLPKMKLTSPSTIRQKTFELVLKFADSFLKQATFSKDLDISDEEFIQFIQSSSTDES